MTATNLRGCRKRDFSSIITSRIGTFTIIRKQWVKKSSPMSLSPCHMGIATQIFYRPQNKVWGKIIFSEACVSHSVHRGICVVGEGGMRGGARGACMVWGMHGQGSHFFGLTKFHDISMIFPVFLVNFQVFFSLFLKHDFQVVLNINMQTYWVSF